jgi:hypothetical protein
MKSGFEYSVTHNDASKSYDQVAAAFHSYFADVQSKLHEHDPNGSVLPGPFLQRGPKKSPIHVNTVLSMAHTDQIVSDAAQRHNLSVLALRTSF